MAPLCERLSNHINDRPTILTYELLWLAALLYALFNRVMARLAKRLNVINVKEQSLITFMGYDVVCYGCMWVLVVGVCDLAAYLAYVLVTYEYLKP